MSGTGEAWNTPLDKECDPGGHDKILNGGSFPMYEIEALFFSDPEQLAALKWAYALDQDELEHYDDGEGLKTRLAWLRGRTMLP